jgi:hypothetical protein
MKYIAAIILLIACFTRAQGTFVYDQQSSTDTNAAGGGPAIQQYSSLGQSFTPTLSSIGFVQLAFYDMNVGNNLGATIYLNLKTNINGPILTSTTPVFMPDGFGRDGNSAGITVFFFSSPVNLIPGNLYSFELIVQSGDSWATSASEFTTSGANMIVNGQPVGMTDLWFREGIIVPEPSSTLLALLGSGVLLCVLQHSSRRFRHHPDESKSLMRGLQ